MFEEEIMGKGSFARFETNKQKILIDLQDNPVEYGFYSNYDVIFKRSFSTNIHYSSNVYPFGLRFDVFDGLWRVFWFNTTVFLRDLESKDYINLPMKYVEELLIYAKFGGKANFD